jgi:hypothetical protein
MALIKFYDSVAETSTTTGDGTLTLSGIAANAFCRALSATGISMDGFRAFWRVDDLNGNWEIFLGTYTASTHALTRTSVESSSNDGAKVVFGAGTKTVSMVSPASIVSLALPVDPQTGLQYKIIVYNGNIEKEEI